MSSLPIRRAQKEARYYADKALFERDSIRKTFINDYLFLRIMGRIKTQLIKRTTEDIVNKDSEAFTTNFNENKKILDSKLNISSKKMRNVIAGYVTRLKKKGM
jgi:small subunit ribosomal protein S17e